MTVVEPPINDTSNNDDTESILVGFSDIQQLNTSSSSSTNTETSSPNSQQQQQQYQYIQQLLQEIEHLRNELNRVLFEVLYI